MVTLSVKTSEDTFPCSSIILEENVRIWTLMTQSASIQRADWRGAAGRLTLQTGSRRSSGRPQLIYAFLWANAAY